MLTTKSGYKNVLLIDRTVPQAQVFVDAANTDTFPILYSYNTTRAALFVILKQHFTNIDRLGLVFTTEGSGRPKRFLEQAPFFTATEAASSPYSANVEFIISLIRQFQIKNIDYLACATLTYPSWVNYFAILTRETTVIVGASNDKTGNLQYGGDWVLESTSEDIELIYFTESIEYYTHLLDTTGDFTIVMKGTTIYDTGYNSNGQLGLDNISDQPILTPMVDPSNGALGTYYGKNPKYIACGAYHTIVLMTNGSLYATGYNYSGQLGINNTTDQLILTPMVDPINGAVGTYYGKTPKYIACGSLHTIVLMTDGTIYGTGDNSYGQLGINNTTNQPILTLMVNPIYDTRGTYYGKTPSSIACGYTHTIVLMTDGTIYGTGLNDIGQLGLNNTTSQVTLTKMVNPIGKTPSFIACGGEYTIVLMTDGTIYGTGINGVGQLGIDTDTESYKMVLTPMVDPSNGVLGTYYGKTPKYIACGYAHTIVLMTDGTVYGTGNNYSGQLGLNNNDYPIRTLTKVFDPSGSIMTYYGKTPKYIACGDSHTIVLMTDDTVYGTGYNYYGQLGLYNNDPYIDSKYVLTPMLNGTGVTYLMNNYYPEPIYIPIIECKCPLPVKIPRLIITANTQAMRYSVLVQLKNAGCKGQGLVFVTNNNIPPTVPPRNKF
jgi:alpha-tubulin suppressor-like RCC1 family protein